MPEFIWTLPTRSDARRRAPQRWNRGDWEPTHRATFHESLTDVRGDAFGSFDYLAQVVRAADVSGFDGVTIPYDPGGEEAWVVAAAALRASRYLRVAPEFPAGYSTPVYAAKMLTTLQRASAGRLGWRLVVESDGASARSQGDYVIGPDRYRRADEFVTIAKSVLAESTFDFEGEHYNVDNGGFQPPLGGQPFPTLYTSGTTSAALRFAAEHADVHVFEGDARDVVAERVHALRARERDRRVRVAVTLPVIAREHRDEAFAKARRLHALAVDEAARSGCAGRADGAEVSEPVFVDGSWTGFHAIGLGQPYGLVGSFDEVAEHLRALSEVGVDVFILDTPGRLEGAYLLGENLLPRFAGEPVPA